MRENELLLKKIIPPKTREERDCFSNEEIIAELNQEQIKYIEKRLIELLETDHDYLIAETLVHIKSEKSIPEIFKQLKKSSSSFEKIKWASFINEINNGDKEMELIAYNECKKMEFIYEIEGIVFCDLIKFKSPRIEKQIEKYIEHKYFLVNHYAKLVLNYNGYSDNYNQKSNSKEWWEFWK
jgi:hypothetical protein